MLRPRACLGAESDIAEKTSATEVLEPAAARPKKALCVVADLDWPTTARVAGAAIDMVMAAMLLGGKGLRSPVGYASRSGRRGTGRRATCGCGKNFHLDVDEARAG